MSIIYLIGIVVVVKLFHSLYKSDRINKEQIHERKIVDDRSRFAGVPEKCNTDSISPKKHILAESIYSEEDRPEMSEKNKWLYPTNGFGKMEEGVVD